MSHHFSVFNVTYPYSNHLLLSIYTPDNYFQAPIHMFHYFSVFNVIYPCSNHLLLSVHTPDNYYQSSIIWHTFSVFNVIYKCFNHLLLSIYTSDKHYQSQIKFFFSLHIIWKHLILNVCFKLKLTTYVNVYFQPTAAKTQ